MDGLQASSIIAIQRTIRHVMIWLNLQRCRPSNTIVSALKGHFAAIESDDDRGVNETRGYACEIVAWRLVTHLSEREAINFLLSDLTSASSSHLTTGDDAESQATTEPSKPASHNPFYKGTTAVNPLTGERAPLISNPPRRSAPANGSFYGSGPMDDEEDGPAEQEGDLTSTFEGMNALEIAAVSGAKKFLSQRVVQRIVYGIWSGKIVFWETLSVDSVKKARLYNKR